MMIDKKTIFGLFPVILITLVFSIGVGMFYLFSPSAKSLKALQKQATTLQKEIDSINKKELPQLRQRAAILSEVEVSYQKFLEKISKAEEKIPLKEKLGTFLEQLFQEAKESEVDFFLIRSKKEVEFKDYIELPVEIQVRSDFLKLGKYLEKIEGMQRLANIDRLDINGANRYGSLVEAKLFASTYVMKKMD